MLSGRYSAQDNLMSKLKIKEMTVQERLQTMEEIWDSLLHEDIEIESPQWHEDILKERRKKLEQGKTEFISLADLQSRYK